MYKSDAVNISLRIKLQNTMTKETEKTSRRLVEALLEYCDIDVAELEGEDRVLLSIDGKTAFLIRVEGGLVHLAGFPGVAPATQRFYLMLLQENFKSSSGIAGCRYALDPKTGELVMSLSIQADGLAQDRFIREFQRFVAVTVRWSNSLLAGSEEAPSFPDAEEAGPDVTPGRLDVQARV